MKLTSKECRAVLMALSNTVMSPSQKRALESGKAKLVKGANL